MNSRFGVHVPPESWGRWVLEYSWSLTHQESSQGPRTVAGSPEWYQECISLTMNTWSRQAILKGIWDGLAKYWLLYEKQVLCLKPWLKDEWRRCGQTTDLKEFAQSCVSTGHCSLQASAVAPPGCRPPEPWRKTEDVLGRGNSLASKGERY